MKFVSPLPMSLLALVTLSIAPGRPSATASPGGNPPRPLCSCSPRSFVVVLDFANGCDADTVVNNAGITETSCDIEVDGPGLKPDGAPVSISSVTFVELDIMGSVINMDLKHMDSNIATGSSLRFDSISRSLIPDAALDDQILFLPASAILFMIGENAGGQTVTATFLWEYNVNCDAGRGGEGVAPKEGDVLAWNVWSDVEGPLGEFCSSVRLASMDSSVESGRSSPSTRPRSSPTLTLQLTPTLLPTFSPIYIPSFLPATKSTVKPTVDPTIKPIKAMIKPTIKPTYELTVEPTDEPTVQPTVEQTDEPTVKPTDEPTDVPKVKPTAKPTDEPTVKLTDRPTTEPTIKPTDDPTNEPTAKPTKGTDEPTAKPTVKATDEPSVRPTDEPAVKATDVPTTAPAIKATDKPTAKPTIKPTDEPTVKPTDEPTFKPAGPTYYPTGEPTHDPTIKPTDERTTKPTYEPTVKRTVNEPKEKLPEPTPVVTPTTKPASSLSSQHPSSRPISSEGWPLGGADQDRPLIQASVHTEDKPSPQPLSTSPRRTRRPTGHTVGGRPSQPIPKPAHPSKDLSTRPLSPASAPKQSGEDGGGGVDKSSKATFRPLTTVGPQRRPTSVSKGNKGGKDSKSCKSDKSEKGSKSSKRGSEIAKAGKT